MKYILIIFSVLTVITSLIQAMQVAPEPIETAAQKGARFKNECIRIAKTELARKKEHGDRLRLGNPDLSVQEVNEIAQQEVIVLFKLQIKNTLRTVFPQAPLLGTPVALREWLERETDRYIKEAEEENALRAARKCSFFAVCCD